MFSSGGGGGYGGGGGGGGNWITFGNPDHKSGAGGGGGGYLNATQAVNDGSVSGVNQGVPKSQIIMY